MVRFQLSKVGKYWNKVLELLSLWYRLDIYLFFSSDSPSTLGYGEVNDTLTTFVVAQLQIDASSRRPGSKDARHPATPEIKILSKIIPV